MALESEDEVRAQDGHDHTFSPNPGAGAAPPTASSLKQHRWQDHT